MTESALDSLVALNSAQSRLADRLLEGSIPARTLLVAPTGSGKTHLAAEVARRILESDNRARVLFIVSHRVIARLLDESLPGRHVELFTRAALREEQASGPLTFTGPVTAFTTDRALAAEDIRATLVGTHWDLVVVDEVHSLATATWTLIRPLIEGGHVDRLLVLGQATTSAPLEDEIVSSIPGLDVERWQFSPALRPDIAPHVRRRVRFVTFRRTGAEALLLTQANALAKTLEGWIDSRELSRLVHAGESSFYALEQEALAMLYRLRRRRNVLAHSQTPPPEKGPSGGAEEMKVMVRALGELEVLVDRLDALSSDSKTQRFDELLAYLRTEAPQGPACVFVSSVATGTYLESRLAESGGTVLLLSGEGGTVKSEIERIAAENGTVIVLDQALSVYDLRSFKVGIHYDIPASEEGWQERFGRLGWLEHPDEVRTWALVEEGTES